jgi:DNA gyrase/topoisomerase IV subunit A
LTVTDFIMSVLPATTAFTLYVFTGDGYMYQLPVCEIPKTDGPGGRPSVHAAQGFQQERPCRRGVCAGELPCEGELLFVTRGGMAKKTNLKEYDTRNRKYAACGVRDGDEIIHAGICRKGHALVLISRGGMALQMSYSQIPEMGRTQRACAPWRWTAATRCSSPATATARANSCC